MIARSINSGKMSAKYVTIGSRCLMHAFCFNIYLSSFFKDKFKNTSSPKYIGLLTDVA